MARTVPNITGDILTSVVVAKSEGLPLVPVTAPDFSSTAADQVAQPVPVAAAVAASDREGQVA